MKKLLSLLLASLMLFGMVFAAEAAPDRESLFQVALLQSLAQGKAGDLGIGGRRVYPQRQGRREMGFPDCPA